MTRMIRLWLIAATMVGAPALAGERAVPVAALPAAVVRAATARFPDAQVKTATEETKQAKTVYELALSNGVELKIASEGKVLGQEQTIAFADLPSAVRQTLATAHARAKAIRSERVVDEEAGGAVRYEVVVREKGERHELTFGERGELLSDERLKNGQND